MGSAAEIGWTSDLPDGGKRHVFAKKHGRNWNFFERPKRKGADIQWTRMEEPALEDWMSLLEAMERRAARDLSSPADVKDLRRVIRERFPDAFAVGSGSAADE